MAHFLKDLIARKLKQLSTDEIIHYGNQYGFQITTKQANSINAYLKKNKIDPFQAKEREKMLLQLASITDKETAQKANKLFVELVKSYGLESLFKE